MHTGYEQIRSMAGVVTGVRRLHENGKGDAYQFTPEQWLEAVHADLPNPNTGIIDPLPPGTRRTALTYDSAGNWLTREERTEANELPTPVALAAWLSGSLSGADQSQTAVESMPNGLNQLGGASSELVYDANGNLRDDGTRWFEYDAFGQMVAAGLTNKPEVRIEYEYDGLGRMVVRREGGESEWYAYDGPHLVAILDGETQDAKQSFVYEPDGADAPVMMRLHASSSSYADYFFERDGHGSVVALVDADGTVLERYRYDPWGRVDIEDGFGTRLLASAFDNRLMYASRLALRSCTQIIWREK